MVSRPIMMQMLLMMMLMMMVSAVIRIFSYVGLTDNVVLYISDDTTG